MAALVAATRLMGESCCLEHSSSQRAIRQAGIARDFRTHMLSLDFHALRPSGCYKSLKSLLADETIAEMAHSPYVYPFSVT